jgi:tetratricopeptide (TPR) repeat protein
MRRSVPLVWRVPNAPATFVGRRDELAAIRAASQRGPLVVVCGPGGIGKTALVSAAVRDVFTKQSSRALMVSARASPMQQVFVDIVRALGHVEPRDATDLTMHVIDLAEDRRALVVLDDLHHVLPEIEPTLVAVARYARRSTWIATSRAFVGAPELAGQTVTLAPLSEKNLATLARLVDTKLSRDDADRVAREAEGSPWRALQIAGERNERLDDTSRALLAALLVVERPITAAALAETTARDVARPLAELIRRGFVEELPGGFRIHDAARSWVESRVPAGEGVRTIAALAAGSRIGSVEALGLALKSGDETRALEICASSFDEMLRAGHAATLWRLVAPRTGAAWNGYKLRAAVRLSSVKITSVLDEPPKDALHDRLLWVRALVVEARSEQALTSAESLAEAGEASGDAHVTFWAKLQRAMAARFNGPLRALELIDGARAFDAPTRDLHAALSAFWLAEAGRIDDAITTLEKSRLGRDAPDARDAASTSFAEEILGGPLDLFVRYYRMAAFMECGHLDRAHDELTRGEDELASDDRLRASYVQLVGIANLAIARGRLEDASAILARLLRAAPSGSSVYHTIARLLDVECHVASGAFDGTDVALGALLEETRGRNALVHAWCEDTLERLDTIHAVRPDPSRESDLADSPLGSVARGVMAQRRALRRARWGLPHEAPTSVDIEGTIVREMVAATDAIARADASNAIARAARAIDVAQSHGWGIRECEARVLLVSAASVAGDERRRTTELRALEQRAASMRSTRFEMDARVLAAMFDDPPLDFAALEEIALAESVSPAASRCARALLGDESATLDALDARVVSAARDRANVEVLRVHPSRDARGWGLDTRRRMLWLPSGKRVSLARHAILASVLEVLARAGGKATFEDLAARVWERRVYHPLTDGNRMRVTFHRLRALVEDDPQRPARVLLGGASYELGPERFTFVCNAK